MTSRRADSLILLMLGAIVFLLGGVIGTRTSATSMSDFKVLYCGSRCLIEHRDPYDPKNMEHVFTSEVKEDSAKALYLKKFWTEIIGFFPYLPSVWFLAIPFALLPLNVSIALWVVLIALLYLSAVFLIWLQIGDESLWVPVLLLAQFIASSRILFPGGNPAGIVVGLTVVAVWCFLSERFEAVGVFCLASSLAIKPHDVGFVWLFFLLAGGRYRKLAWQTLVLTVVLGLPGVLWVWSISPHWITELHRNLIIASSRGGLAAPGPAALSAQSTDAMLINLQTLMSMAWDNARFYSLASYGLCAVLLVIWGIMTLRSRRSAKRDWMALAAISALSLLPVYHRTYDTRLLVLIFPAFSTLWAEKGAIRWTALAVTGAGVLATAGLVPMLLRALAQEWHLAAGGVGAKILNVVMIRPIPIALLATAVFYLWVYVRYVRAQSVVSDRNDAALSGS